MGVINGKIYKQRLDAQNSAVVCDGKEVKGAISKHPVFQGLIDTQSQWYDLQCRKENLDTLSYFDTEINERCGISFLSPRSKEDLEKKRIGYQKLAALSNGLLGRSPEYLNTALMVFNDSAQLFQDGEDGRAEAVKRYIADVKKTDKCLTHTFIQPQVNRSSFYMENDDEIIAARVIKETKDGLILHGARLLATQGPTTNDIMIFPSGAELHTMFAKQGLTYAFSIPNNTKGVTYYCRQSYAGQGSVYDSPLSSRLEEMDTLVVFDHVLIPWDNVFFHNNIVINNRIYQDSGFFPHVTHQIMSKNVIKLEFILGLARSLVNELNISEFQHIQSKIADIIIALETVKSFVYSSESQGAFNQWGVFTPAESPLVASSIFFPETYPELIEILQKIGASGLVNLPVENDFLSDHGETLSHYLQSSQSKGYDRVKLFRLAWDLTMSAYGTRQTQYERFFFGDPIRLKSQLFRQFDQTAQVNQVTQFMKSI